ncbi:MAG: CRISPR-associated protein Csx19 [Pyrinomonadaceae bacterium]
MVENELTNIKLNTNRADGKTLSESVAEFIKVFGESLPKTFAVLYSPGDCLLSLVDEQGNFTAKANEVALNKIFEARIFNDVAELRWLNETDGCGAAAVLSKKEFPFFGRTQTTENCVETIKQNYLLWGEISPSNQADENWTELAEARIGKFYVPIKTTSRACFEAKEYLKEFADGNVAVFEERLTGISEVK